MDPYEGFDEFVAAHSAGLLRVAYLLTAGRGDAEDLVQTALLRVAARWQRLADGDPYAYARRVIYHEFVSIWRYRRRRPEIPMGQLPDQMGVDVSDQTTRRLALAAVLRRLTPHQRAVVVLRFYEDMSESDVAAALRCSVGTVKSQSHRALNRLRDLLPDFAATSPEETP